MSYLYLQHHGVKGMKWGVRKSQRLLGKADRAYARGDKVSAEKYKAKAKAAEEKHQFKQDVKKLRKAYKGPDTIAVIEADGRINKYDSVTMVKSSIAAQKGEEYANRANNKAWNQYMVQKVAPLAGMAVVATGYTYLQLKALAD